MENQEIIIITVVAITALLSYTTYYWKSEYEKLWIKVKSPSQIPTSPNPPPPPRTFIERNPYLCSKRRIEALNSITAVQSLRASLNQEYLACVEAEIKLIRKAQLEFDETKD